jgi:hypothetical protein
MYVNAQWHENIGTFQHVHILQTERGEFLIFKSLRADTFSLHVRAGTREKIWGTEHFDL